MCAAWLGEIGAPEVAAILFRIGPAALGIETAQRIENEHSLALFEDLLTRARSAGEVGDIDIALAARLINALMAELALARLRTRGGAAQPDARALILGLLKGMAGAD